jgi:hypothetical protein
VEPGKRLNPPQLLHKPVKHANTIAQINVLVVDVNLVVIVVVQVYAGEDVILGVILAPAVIRVAKEHAVMDVRHVQIMLMGQQVKPVPGDQEMEL